MSTRNKSSSGFVGIFIVVIPLLVLALGGAVLYTNKITNQKEQVDEISDTEEELDFEDVIYSGSENQDNQDESSQATPTTKQDAPTKAVSKVVPTKTDSSNGSFESYGLLEIEGGAKVQITSAKLIGNELKIHIIFSNPSESDKQVGPLRTSMHSKTYGYPPDPAPSPMTLSPGQKREFDFKYYPEEDPPYRWIYANFSGTQVDLAKYSK